MALKMAFSNLNNSLLVRCESCGEIHAVEFRNLRQFRTRHCPVEHSPLFKNPRSYKRVFDEMENDFYKEALAI